MDLPRWWINFLPFSPILKFWSSLLAGSGTMSQLIRRRTDIIEPEYWSTGLNPESPLGAKQSRAFRARNLYLLGVTTTKKEGENEQKHRKKRKAGKNL